MTRSASAVSQEAPTLPTEGSISGAARRSVQRIGRERDARSELWIKLLLSSGFLCRSAGARASRTNRVVIEGDTRQPRTRRTNTLMIGTWDRHWSK